jgi:hypothetical protein
MLELMNELTVLLLAFFNKCFFLAFSDCILAFFHELTSPPST